MGGQGTQTTAVHAGYDHDDGTGAVAPPIYQTTTFAFESAEQGARRFAGEDDGYIYTRYANPTLAVFEKRIAALEGTEAALATASGMAAISTVLLGLLKAGDHVVATDALYTATVIFLRETLPGLGIGCTIVDGASNDAIADAMREETRVVYCETPGNPTLELVDLAAVAEIGGRWGVTTVCDNTFATPINQRPAELGVDIVVHSATKYIGGHGDILGGAICGAREVIDDLWSTHIQIGGCMSPFNAFLGARGMQTLPLRMRAHNENAMRVAQALEEHPEIARVIYPGLPSHPQHELAGRQMDGFGGMVCFELTGGVEAGRRMMNAVELCTLAVSLGDVKTLISHPASMTHAGLSREDREASGITDGLVRLSVGIEDADDIIEDLRQALERV
ncbi:MAG: trans-sulfuration enzyme family protein [Armatimonadota bacterium]|jgi:methionine-gamma-lyase